MLVHVHVCVCCTYVHTIVCCVGQTAIFGVINQVLRLIAGVAVTTEHSPRHSIYVPPFLKVRHFCSCLISDSLSVSLFSLSLSLFIYPRASCPHTHPVGNFPAIFFPQFNPVFLPVPEVSHICTYLYIHPSSWRTSHICTYTHPVGVRIGDADARRGLSLSIYIYVYICIHTHTYIHTYIAVGVRIGDADARGGFSFPQFTPRRRPAPRRMRTVRRRRRRGRSPRCLPHVQVYIRQTYKADI